MRSPIHRTASAVALAAALGTTPLALAQGTTSRPDPIVALLAVAADADGDGAVSAAERTAFLDGVPDTGGLTVLAVLLRPVFDRDRNGSLGATDLAPAFGALDADGDGRVTGAERVPQRAGAASRPYDALLVRAADGDGDGTTTRAEWDAWLAAVPEAVDTATLTGWIRAGSAPEDADRTAFTPSVFVLSLDSRLDVDGNGRRDRGDLEAMFARIDANADGVVTAAEFDSAPSLAPVARTRRARGWPMPTAEDRARPPEIPWQRTLDDALALVEASGKPLLVCVNMDGETASDSIAWVFYRDPEWVELMRGFVPVLASPDQREPRDHDDRGRRLPDRRFGRLIDAEHIAIEPELYERYFDGRRVAPRHVGVAADGTKLFDVFLATSSEPIEAALREHGRRDLSLPQVAPDDVDGLLASPDAAHRDRLEAMFADGSRELRVRLARAALDPERTVRHPEVLRMALLDPDPAVAEAGVATLAAHGGTDELHLFVSARRAAAGSPALRARLVDALHRIATAATADADRSQATRLARLQEGLAVRSRLIDPDRWLPAVRADGEPRAEPDEAEFAALDAALEAFAKAREAVDGTPDAVRIDARLAALNLRYAEVLIATAQDPRFVLMDAVRLGDRALAGGINGIERGRALGVLALAHWLSNETDAALAAALEALPLLVADAGSALAGRMLGVFVDLRTRDLYRAIDEGREWPAAWVADVLAARTVMLEHPATTEAELAATLDWLDVVGAWTEEGTAVRAALARFPTSPTLHERFRGQLLRDGGAAAVAPGYASLSVAPGQRAALDWFRGVARLAAAERHAQNRLPAAADDEYAAAVTALLDSIEAEPSFADSANHYVALALAGRARLALDRGETEAAAAQILDAIRANPASATWADGLGNTPTATATAIRDALDADAGAALEAGLLELGVELRRRSRRSEGRGR